MSADTQNARLWIDRAQRMRTRTLRKKADLERSLAWYLGGRRFFERHGKDLAKAHKWCFIVGCNNSGTSLLQSILTNSGQVSTMLHEGQRYTRVLTRAGRKGYERVWTEYIDDLRLTSEDSLGGVPRLLHDWLRELSTPIQPVIVEKTPANTARMTWLQEAFPNSYFIGLIRNGYAVAEGIRRKGHKPLDRAARHWNLVNKILLEDAAKVDRFLEVRYEEMVSDRLAVSKRIADFIGLDFDKLEQAMTESYGFSTVRGAQSMPIEDLNAVSLQRLNAGHKTAIYDAASEMLTRLGYDRTA